LNKGEALIDICKVQPDLCLEVKLSFKINKYQIVSVEQLKLVCQESGIWACTFASNFTQKVFKYPDYLFLHPFGRLTLQDENT
jgi:hypothetical protein